MPLPNWLDNVAGLIQQAKVAVGRLYNQSNLSFVDICCCFFSHSVFPFLNSVFFICSCGIVEAANAEATSVLVEVWVGLQSRQISGFQPFCRESAEKHEELPSWRSEALGSWRRFHWFDLYLFVDLQDGRSPWALAEAPKYAGIQGRKEGSAIVYVPRMVGRVVAFFAWPFPQPLSVFHPWLALCVMTLSCTWWVDPVEHLLKMLWLKAQVYVIVWVGTLVVMLKLEENRTFSGYFVPNNAYGW